eukprot:694031-Amorphochlora_amoeboformis.AAC.1
MYLTEKHILRTRFSQHLYPKADDPSEGSHIRFERKGSVDVYKEVSVKNELFSRSQQAEEAFKRQHLSYIRNKNKQYILEMWRGISLVYVLL